MEFNIEKVTGQRRLVPLYKFRKWSVYISLGCGYLKTLLLLVAPDWLSFVTFLYLMWSPEKVSKSRREKVPDERF